MNATQTSLLPYHADAGQDPEIHHVRMQNIKTTSERCCNVEELPPRHLRRQNTTFEDLKEATASIKHP